MIGKVLTAVVIVLFIGTGHAIAKKKKAAPPVKRPGKVIDIGEMEVQGKIWKPWVMDIGGMRLQIKYKGIPLKGDFLNKVLEPTEKNEF